MNLKGVKVGDTLILERYSHREKVHNAVPVTVSRVGRKYLTATEVDRRHAKEGERVYTWDREFVIETGRERTGYSNAAMLWTPEGYELKAKFEEAKDTIERSGLSLHGMGRYRGKWKDDIDKTIALADFLTAGGYVQ